MWIAALLPPFHAITSTAMVSIARMREQCSRHFTEFRQRSVNAAEHITYAGKRSRKSILFSAARTVSFSRQRLHKPLRRVASAPPLAKAKQTKPRPALNSAGIARKNPGHGNVGSPKPRTPTTQSPPRGASYPNRYSTPMAGRGLSHFLTTVPSQAMRHVPHSRQPA